VANQQVIQSTHTGTLPIPQLPHSAAEAHTFNELQRNLVGVSPLTDAGCTVLLDRDATTFQCPGTNPIKCPATGTGLWSLTLKGLKTAVTAVARVAIAVDQMLTNKTHEPFQAMVAIRQFKPPSRPGSVPPHFPLVPQHLNFGDRPQQGVLTTLSLPPLLGLTTH
jgi:hypothetical protein